VRRDAWIWTACFIAASCVVVLTRFASDDPDSALYANLSARLVQEPIARWIAPQWWGFWDSSGLFREHPAGVLWLPALLGRAGIPAGQAAYVQGLAAAIGSLLLIGALIGRVASAAVGRASLIWLQLMPVAFIFRIRANHEYPMLFCLVVTLVALDGVRRSWRWLPVVAAALAAALLIKGVFVILILLAAGLWMLINPPQTPGPLSRPIVALVVGLATMVAVAALYDALYLRVTGEGFWGPYWQRQLSPLTMASPLSNTTSWIGHLVFYFSRLLWHPAPWSFAILLALWSGRRSRRVAWYERPVADWKGTLFVALFVLMVIALLTPSSRFAERYAFSATYAVAALGIVIACRRSPAWIGAPMDWPSTAIAAIIWLGLIVLRVVLGPLLPRLSWS
jgi:4-amino-4-deoxy-L-arabinose transferase-like glycosyltransferase